MSYDTEKYAAHNKQIVDVLKTEHEGGKSCLKASSYFGLFTLSEALRAFSSLSTSIFFSRAIDSTGAAF